MCVCMCMYICMYAYVHMYVCIYVCMYVCMYVVIIFALCIMSFYFSVKGQADFLFSGYGEASVLEPNKAK